MSIDLAGVPRFTEDELIEIAVQEEFLLFCDEDSFVQIAQHIEEEVRCRIASAGREAS